MSVDTKIMFSCLLVMVWMVITVGTMRTDFKRKDPKMYTYVYNPIGLVAFNGFFGALLYKIWMS